MWGSYIVRDMAQVNVGVLYCQRYGPGRCGGSYIVRDMAHVDVGDIILSEIWPT